MLMCIKPLQLLLLLLAVVVVVLVVVLVVKVVVIVLLACLLHVADAFAHYHPPLQPHVLHAVTCLTTATQSNASIPTPK